jgi:hypothetical protein
MELSAQHATGHWHPFVDASNDPAGTATLRRKFMRASDKRWRAACRLVMEAVGNGDLLGLGQPNLNSVALRARHGGMAGADPVTGFRHWLDNLLRDVVVGHDGSWMAPFVSSAEELAAKRARDIGVSVPPPSMSMTLPHRALVLSELHALATLGVQRGTRAAASALASRQRPQAAARRIVAALREAMARSRLMADFAVAKTNAAMLLEHFRAAGITHVGVDSSACKPKRYGVKTKRGVKLRMRDRDPPWFKPDIGKENQALLIGELRKALPDLPAQARKLGSDLILASTGSRGISIKQAGLVGKLIRQSGGEVPELEPIGKAEEAEPAAGAPDLSELIGKAGKAKAKLEELDTVNVLTAGDDNVCSTCEDISEEGPYDINEAQELIPAHPNSFMPGTRVQGEILAALKAFYSGPAVEIVSRSGERLRVTVNHPVMTNLGAVAAGDLREGMQLLRQCGVMGRGAQARGMADQDNNPPLIEEIFETLRRKGFVSVAPSADDLHGDAGCIYGDIDIVCADGRLLGHMQTAHAQRGGEFIFPEANMAASGLAGLRSLRLLKVGLYAATRRSPRLGALTLNGRMAVSLDAGPFQTLCCGTPADSNAIATQELTQNIAPYSALAGELFERCAGDVSLDQLGNLAWLKNAAWPAGIAHFNAAAFDAAINHFARQAGFLRNLDDAGALLIERDEIVELRRFEYVGHVYDVQSTKGWIITPNLLCFQCRCTFVPADDARFSQTEFGGGEIPEEEEEPVEPGVAAETLLSQFGAGARKAGEAGLGAVQTAFEEPEEAEALVPEVEAPELPAGVAAAAELGEPEEGEEEGLGAGGVVAAALGLGAAAAGAAGLLGGRRRREEPEEEAPMPETKEPIDYPEDFAGHTAAEYTAYVNRWLDWALENGWTEDMIGERWDDEEALRDKVGMTPEQEEALLQRVDEVASLVEK